MSRTNPRSVILAALQEGPLPLTGGNFTHSLASVVWLECLDGLERGWRCAYQAGLPLLDRHLCKLIRSRKVVRLGDGRYALSNPWTRMLARCAKIDMDWRDFLPVPRNAESRSRSESWAG